MMDKYPLVLGLHLLTTALILKIINYILPCLTVWACSYIFSYFAWACIAAITFQFTKNKFLNEKVGTENRAVFITGCDSGFGNALAKRLDSKGFTVFASCLFPDGEGATKLKASCSNRLRVLPLDVRRSESVEKAVEYVKENLGTSELWAVVNNAGILRGYSAEQSTMEEFEDVLDVNFLGTVRVTKAFIPLLKKSKGRVVNVTSLGGEITIPFITPYLTSKHAAVAFSDCLRHEIYRQGISVVTIEPEIFLTPLLSSDNMDKNFYSRLESDNSSNHGEKLMIDAFLAFACPHIDIVVDDMESAVSLVHPDHTYKPRRHALARFIFCAFKVMPRSFQILLVQIVLFIFLSKHKIIGSVFIKMMSVIR